MSFALVHDTEQFSFIQECKSKENYVSAFKVLAHSSNQNIIGSRVPTRCAHDVLDYSWTCALQRWKDL